jgi:hypothetical protein
MTPKDTSTHARWFFVTYFEITFTEIELWMTEEFMKLMLTFIERSYILCRHFWGQAFQVLYDSNLRGLQWQIVSYSVFLCGGDQRRHLHTGGSRGGVFYSLRERKPKAWYLGLSSPRIWSSTDIGWLRHRCPTTYCILSTHRWLTNGPSETLLDRLISKNEKKTLHKGFLWYLVLLIHKCCNFFMGEKLRTRVLSMNGINDITISLVH